MAYFEKMWNCPACGRTHISALRQMKCPSCGHAKVPQDQEIATHREITDAKGLELARGGPHWACECCGSVNLDSETSCSGCGNPKGSSGNKEFKVIEYGTSDPASAPRRSEPNPRPQPAYFKDSSRFRSDRVEEYERRRRATPLSSPPSPPKKNSFDWSFLKNPITYYVLGGILLIFLIYMLFFATTQYQASVSELTWQREIAIEDFNRYHESGWSRPYDAYNVSSYQKVQYYRDVYRTETKTVTETETRYRDNGNGSTESYTVPVTRTVSEQVFDHSEPVYGTWYEYDVDEWRYTRSVKSSGSDKEPYWPEFTLYDNPSGKYGDEREGGGQESYMVYFQATIKDKLRTFTKNLGFDAWLGYNVGDIYLIKVNNVGMIIGEPVIAESK